jgi:2C-methyl-D-erythritol 2,4-cyclodiphosphate synthase
VINSFSGNIGLNKLEQMFEEIIKQTWEDAKETDSLQEQQRKLNEKNYNSRVLVHIKESLLLAGLLYTRYSAPMSDAMPLKKAMEF